MSHKRSNRNPPAPRIDNAVWEAEKLGIRQLVNDGLYPTAITRTIQRIGVFEPTLPQVKAKLDKWGFTCGPVNVDQNQTSQAISDRDLELGNALMEDFDIRNPSEYTDMNTTSSDSGFRIYVSNLPDSIRWQDLVDLFSRVALEGTIISVDVSTDPGVGQQNARIVTFELFDDARNIIKQFNGCIWQDRRLEIREDHLPQFDGVYHGSNHTEMTFLGRTEHTTTSSSQNIGDAPTQIAPVYNFFDLENFDTTGFEFR